MKVSLVFALGILLGGSVVWLSYRRPTAPAFALAAAKAPPLPAMAAAPVVAAAQGRAEGWTENIEVEASVDGVIRSLLVTEGRIVAKGEVIAEIACDDLDSDIRALAASRESAIQARARLLRGSRDEERSVAEQDVIAAQAVVEHARRQYDRMQSLASKDDVSQQKAEDAKRDLDTAEATLRGALDKQKLINAGPLPEEVAKADADVAAAEEKLHTAVAQREKCTVRAPIRGTVTRVNMRVGEAFSMVIPRPIVTMADLSGRRIRAEVDERDVSKIHVNQPVRISADGYPQPFSGKVTWTSMIMGRKTVRSTDPADKADRDILETLIVPDRGAPLLPLGFRVVVEFLRN